MKSRLLLLTILALTLALFSCRKEEIFSRTQTNLIFSADTIFLDTVFANVGSSTRVLRVKNPSNNDIYIDRISLAKGNASYYRLNVNGTATKDIKDVELLAGDSINIFIEVTADVGNANEILYTDSIIFNTQGNLQDVDLVTLAKDAYFHYPNKVLTINQSDGSKLYIPYSILTCNDIWTNDKPHVIYGYAVIDSACTLTALPGTQIHFHNGSGLWVYRSGSLQLDPNDLGDLNNPIEIQGDRLEPFYEEIPGQWGGILGGIFIQGGSSNNIIRNTIIKNGTIALRVDSADENGPANLELTNVILKNHSRAGLYAGYSHILGDNVVIGNCGVYTLYALGGRYRFRHSTFANYWTGGNRSTPAIGLFNYFEDNFSNRYIRDVVGADFLNCVVYGNNSTEFGLGKDNSGTLTFKFDGCLLKINVNPIDGSYNVNDPNFFSSCILNTDPKFESPFDGLFSPDSLSPLIDAALIPTAQLVPEDLYGKSRLPNPDIGAIER